MTGLSLTAVEVLAGVGVLLVLWTSWRVGVRRGRAAADAARGGARLLSLTGRVLFTAALIVGAQWLVIVYAGTNKGLLLAVLGFPALFAAYALTRALTVTTLDGSRRRGGRR